MMNGKKEKKGNVSYLFKKIEAYKKLTYLVTI